MAIKRLIVGLLKLLLGGFAFFVGLMAGSMIAARMQLPPPPLPEGTNQEVLLTLYIMVSPIWRHHSP